MSRSSVAPLSSLPDVTPALVAEVHRVVAAVVDLGGAVGWLSPPPVAEVAQWLQDWRTAARSGRADLLLARVDGRVEAIGAWRAGPVGPVGHVVELTKIMTHPDARGTGLGRRVLESLLDGARGMGAELAVLGVRGNNHGAQALYESVGFTVWGTLPNGVAVGDDRFDDVRMYRQLALPVTAVLHRTTAGPSPDPTSPSGGVISGRPQEREPSPGP